MGRKGRGRASWQAGAGRGGAGEEEEGKGPGRRREGPGEKELAGWGGRASQHVAGRAGPLVRVVVEPHRREAAVVRRRRPPRARAIATGGFGRAVGTVGVASAARAGVVVGVAALFGS